MTPTLHETPFFRRLAASSRILIAGAGGGFDVMSGLPLALALEALGKQVHLANLTFTYLGASDARPLAPALHEVTSATQGDEGYFPERHLASWRAGRGEDDRVYCFEKARATKDLDVWMEGGPRGRAARHAGAARLRGAAVVHRREEADVHDKDEVAARLIAWHFRIEPDLSAVYRILSASEDATGEPIKLLEVNGATVDTGRVVPFAFGPAGDITYPSVVAEVTPAEMDAIRRHAIALPAGWSLENAREFLRPRTADAA